MSDHSPNIWSAEFYRGCARLTSGETFLIPLATKVSLKQGITVDSERLVLSDTLSLPIGVHGDVQPGCVEGFSTEDRRFEGIGDDALARGDFAGKIGHDERLVSDENLIKFDNKS
jgi:hypothetical protein